MVERAVTMQKNINLNFTFFSLLTIAFIVLKLCNVIDWSWWWVLAPTWMPIAIVAIIVVIVVIKKKIDKKRGI